MAPLSTDTTSFQNMATVRFHDSHKTPPILTAGDVSPAILAQLLQYFNSYFHKCKVANEDKVRNVLLSFQDIKIDNWIKNNQERLLAEGYTFETFTSELRKHFLNPHWESTIVRTVVNSQMTATESFSTFANRIMQGNNLLIGTTSRLDTTSLRAKLEINMSGYLADKIARLRPAEKERISSIVLFEDWLAEISTLDDEITADLKRIADFATEHIAKRQRTDNSSKGFQQNMYQSHNPSRDAPLSGANATVPSYNNVSSSTFFRGGYRGSTSSRPFAGKRTRCPKLLPEEYDLLDRHNGCKKCRRFYVGHQATNCPNDFPNPDTYQTLTEEMANQAMAQAAIASTYNANTSSYSPQPTSFVEEAQPIPSISSPIAAVLPPSIPFNLGTGASDTDSDPSSTT
jgi:hypothetical protein